MKLLESWRFWLTLFLLAGIGLCVAPSCVKASNIRINGTPRVVDFIGAAKDTAIVEFGLSWDNSWRDDFNWDAAWIFLKYKKRGVNAEATALTEWEHAYLCREGHSAVPQSGNGGGEYMFMFGEVGTAAAAKVTGLYLLRNEVSEGNVNVKLRLKWPLKANTRSVLSIDDFGKDRDQVFVMAYAVEMVYVPYGAYFLGDNYSNGSFTKNGTGPIPPVYDVMDLSSGYEYSTKTAIDYGAAQNVAARVNQPQYPNSTLYFHAPTYWEVDFKEPKKIRYFGIAGASNYPDCTPRGVWTLTGSVDKTNWVELYRGTNRTDWTNTSIAYPVQKSLKIENPDFYRYYRINITATNRPSDNGIVIQSVAMSEEELYPNGYFFNVESENPIVLGQDLQARDGQAWSGSLPAAYPKGYRGFYLMKYELSQEQYTAFLNALNLNQQKARVANNNFAQMKTGDYVFGDLKRPNCRNGIAFIMSKAANAPVVFGNNLNPENPFFAEDDGQTLACNYLSPADMLAYCDWSGLRPMSELEYEKACRRPAPQIPQEGEYGWNAAWGVNRVMGMGDVIAQGTEREVTADESENVNSGGRVNGPLRCGVFATSRTGQVEAGATYWGLMEMCGNVGEMCYNANVQGRNLNAIDFTNSHGDGYLNADGTTNVPTGYWPVVKEAIAVRGGSFAGGDSLLRTSDRTLAVGNYFAAFTTRDSSIGFRAGRSVLNTSGFTAGAIRTQNGLEQDTVCNGDTYTIQGQPAEKAVGKLTYVWYFSEDNGTSWNAINGEVQTNLTYERFANKTNATKYIQFKRKAICAVGEETTNVVTIAIPPVPQQPVVATSLPAGYGHKLVLPVPTATGMKCKWTFSNGVEKFDEDAIISKYTAGDDGIFKVAFVNEAGCESPALEVSVKGMEGVPILNYGDYRSWADGTFAKSANTYLHPTAPYVYAGHTGDGVYKIRTALTNEEVKVYCDMTKHGGGWTRIFTHVWKGNTAAYFWANKNPRKHNVDNPTEGMYSILYLMDDFRSADGKYLFWIDYPQLPVHNIWKQSVNPESYDNTNKSGYITGYEAVDVRITANQWGGLAYGTQSSTYLDGTWYAGNWYYSIGCKSLWGSSFPGPDDRTVTQVYLWMKDE